MIGMRVSTAAVHLYEASAAKRPRDFELVLKGAQARAHQVLTSLPQRLPRRRSHCDRFGTFLVEFSLGDLQKLQTAKKYANHWQEMAPDWQHDYRQAKQLIKATGPISIVAPSTHSRKRDHNAQIIVYDIGEQKALCRTALRIPLALR